MIGGFMARTRNTIARKVTFDMNELAKYIEDKSNEQLGEWFRKAVKDCLEGCVSQDVDCLVKKMYEASLGKMQQKQNIDANTYRNRTAAEKNATTPCTISTNEKTDAGAVSLRGSKPESASHCALAPASNILQLDTSKKPYGTCGHVMLTDAEGHHLREVYGNDLALAIEILDAYLENNQKALKKYKNHAAVMRMGNWIWRVVQENRIKAKQLEKAGTQKSFKQMDRDERTRFFLDTSVVDRMIENESNAM